MRQENMYKKMMAVVLLLSCTSVFIVTAPTVTAQSWQVTKVVDICKAIGVHTPPPAPGPVTVPTPVLPTTAAITMSPGQMLNLFSFSPNFNVTPPVGSTAYTELLWSGTATDTTSNLGKINLALTNGISVVVQLVLSANSAGNYQAVMTAYNAATLQPICQQLYSTVYLASSTNWSQATSATVPFTSSLSTTYINYARTAGTNGTPAADTNLAAGGIATNLSVTALVQNILISVPVAKSDSVFGGGSATLPLATALAALPNNQQSIFVPTGATLSQFWFSPTFGTAGFGELPVGAADLAKMNSAFAAGHNVNIVYDIQPNTAGAGLVLSYKMYDTTTTTMICNNNFPPIQYNGAVIPATATWGYSNFTYQTSNMAKTGMLTGVTASHPQALQIVAGSAPAPVTVPTPVLPTTAAITMSAGQTLSLFTFSPNFNVTPPAGSTAFAELFWSGTASDVTSNLGKINLVLTYGISIVVQLVLSANSANNYQAIMTAYDAATLTQICQQSYPTIYLASSTNWAQPTSAVVPFTKSLSTTYIGYTRTAGTNGTPAADPNGAVGGVSTDLSATTLVQNILISVPAAKSQTPPAPARIINTVSSFTGWLSVFPEFYEINGSGRAQGPQMSFDLTKINPAIAAGKIINIAVSAVSSGAGYNATATATDLSGNVISTATATNVAGNWNYQNTGPILNATYQMKTYHVWGQIQSGEMGIEGILANQTVQIVPPSTYTVPQQFSGTQISTFGGLATLLQGLENTKLNPVAWTGSRLSSNPAYMNFNFGNTAGLMYWSNAWGQGTAFPVAPDISGLVSNANWKTGVSFVLLAVDNNNNLITSLVGSTPQLFYMLVYDTASGNLMGISPVPLSCFTVNGTNFAWSNAWTNTIGIGAANYAAGGSGTYPVVFTITQ